MAASTLTLVQEQRLTVNTTLASGEVISIKDTPVWKVSNSKVVELKTDATGLSTMVIARELGSSTVSVSFKADYHGKSINFSAAQDYHVTGIDITLTANPVEDQPAEVIASKPVTQKLPRGRKKLVK